MINFARPALEFFEFSQTQFLEFPFPGWFKLDKPIIFKEKLGYKLQKCDNVLRTTTLKLFFGNLRSLSSCSARKANYNKKQLT